MTPALPETALLSLLHLCDSGFPTGGFAHSDGLEAATSAGLIGTAAELRAWMEAYLAECLTKCDAAAVAAAWDAFSRDDLEALARIDEEVVAIRPAAASRAASRAMGARLLATWQHLHPETPAKLLRAEHVSSLPAVFGVVCAAAGIAKLAAVEAFIYGRLAATVSAAMRLIAIGQHEAHALLASMLELVPAAAREAASGSQISCFAPALDLAQMSQQYVTSRLFRS